MRLTLSIVLVAISIIACAPPKLTPAQYTKMAGMKLITDKNEVRDRKYTVVAAVTGRAYMRGSIFEKGRMNMEEAYDEMKRKAIAMGADALLLDNCQEIGMTAQSFRTMECSATAIKFEN